MAVVDTCLDGRKLALEPPRTGVTPVGYAFISYSHNDKPFVERMAQQLRKAGTEVWIDRDLTHGERFPDRLEKEIAGSAVFVPVMSKHAQESDWVRKEAGWARKYQRK